MTGPPIDETGHEGGSRELRLAAIEADIDALDDRLDRLASLTKRLSDAAASMAECLAEQARTIERIEFNQSKDT